MKIKKKKTSEEENCIFCKIVNKEIPCYKVWENKKYLAFLDMNPINPGHVLLIPKKHTNYIFDLKNVEYLRLMNNTKKIAKLLKEKLNCKRIGIAVEGFFVPHVHVHIVPLNQGNELNPERAKPMNKEDLKKIQEKITK
ncbi:HIT family protein [Candidatus Woesearchaeota archaeon]|jgi:histidine triad (HIT) family protein|nr:HIT family protein [Candidatus Woesearchaeota archaeon]